MDCVRHTPFVIIVGGLGIKVGVVEQVDNPHVVTEIAPLFRYFLYLADKLTVIGTRRVGALPVSLVAEPAARIEINGTLPVFINVSNYILYPAERGCTVERAYIGLLRVGHRTPFI